MATEFVCDSGGLDAFEFSSQDLGLRVGAAFVGAGAATVRGGVVPAFGNPLKYEAAGGMNGVLRAGRYVMPSTDPSRGVYVLVLPSDVVLAHPTSNASQPRTDLIAAVVEDVGTTDSEKKFVMLPGTAGPGAPAPSLPSSLGHGSAWTLASVNVPANATSLGAITDLRTYTAGAGGVVRVADLAAASALPEATPFYTDGDDWLYWKTAAGSNPIPRRSGGYWTGVSNNVSGDQNILHGLPGTPTKVSVTTALTGDDTVNGRVIIKITGVDATSIGIRSYRTDTNDRLLGNPIAAWWTAEL